MKSAIFLFVGMLLLGLLAACGGQGGGTSGASTSWNQAATGAVQDIQTSDATTQDASTFSMSAFDLGGMVLAGDVSGFDVSGIPAPSSATSQSLEKVRSLGLKPLASGTPSGCVTPDPSDASQARLVASGQGGCTASDHLEVDYANGDKANYSLNLSPTGMTGSASVVSGDWSGTNITVDLELSEDPAGFTLTLSGVMMYSQNGKLVIDTQFNTRFEDIAATEGGSGNSGGRFTFDGDALDLITHRKVHSNFTLTLDYPTGGASFNATWAGSVHIASVDPESGQEDAATTVDFDNLNVEEEVTSLVGNYQVQWYASGNVKYGGKTVGRLEVDQQGNVTILWSDGVSTPFDFSQLLFVA